VGAQLRRVAVGQLAEPDGGTLPEPRPEPSEALLAPGAALALDRLEQRAIVLEPAVGRNGCCGTFLCGAKELRER
jgi:hypothetical protein